MLFFLLQIIFFNFRIHFIQKTFKQVPPSRESMTYLQSLWESMTFQSHYQRGQGAQWGRGGTPYHSSKAQGGEDNRTHTSHSQPTSRLTLIPRGAEQANTPRTASHHAVFLFLSQHTPGIDSGQHATSHHTTGLATPRPRCTPNSWLLKQVATSHNLPAPLTTTFFLSSYCSTLWMNTQ